MKTGSLRWVGSGIFQNECRQWLSFAPHRQHRKLLIGEGEDGQYPALQDAVATATCVWQGALDRLPYRSTLSSMGGLRLSSKDAVRIPWKLSGHISMHVSPVLDLAKLKS